ncbi:MAG: NfeD family protein [Ruminococcus sp.]|nr:NfeD family protein [Ruminococcus sp.]
MEVIFWAGAFILFIIAEVMTVQLVSVWLAVGAFVTMLATYFIGEISFVGQLFIFIAVSSVLLAITFPLMKKQRKKGYIPTNSELEKGKQAVVIEEINTMMGTGRVTLNGVDWKAVSDEIIPINSIVKVISVQGAKLTVELMEVKV